MIFESRTTENVAPKMPNSRVSQALAEVISVWAQLEAIESEYGVKTQREPDPGFCWIAYKWANGGSLQSVLKGSDMSVGDFVRSTKQLVDLLNQIGGASEKLRPICKDAVKRVDRGVVAYLMGDV